MFNFPQSTEVNKIIPKTKLYERADISTSLKNSFINDVEKIVWSNKISSKTLNIEKDSKIEEIHIFTITLKNKNINQKILEVIDKAIPYYIVFILKYYDYCQIWSCYKEKNEENKIKIVDYFHTEWLYEPNLEVKGNKLSSIYANFLKQIDKDFSSLYNDMAGIDINIKKIIDFKNIKHKIEMLSVKIRKEKQYNRQVELHKEQKQLENQLKVIKIGIMT